MFKRLKKRILPTLTILAIAFGGLTLTAPAASAATLTCPATATYNYKGTGGSTYYNQKFNKYSLEKLCTSTPSWYEKNILRKTSYKYWSPVGIYKYNIYKRSTGAYLKQVITKSDIQAIWYPKEFYPFR